MSAKRSVAPLLALAAGLLAGCSANAGEVAKLGPKAKDYTCAPDGKTADAIEQALRINDEDAYGEAAGSSTSVSPGTAIRIEEHVDGVRPKVRVVVLDGPSKGRECWYAANVEGLILVR